MTLVKGQPASKHNALLPPLVEAVLEQERKLPAVMCCSVWAAFFGIDVYLIPFVVLIPIIVKLKTGMNVFECILGHAFHTRANCVE